MFFLERIRLAVYLAPSEWSVYGLRLRNSMEYRYIGLTRGNVRERLWQHKHPGHNPQVPVSKWAGVHGDDVVLDVLETVPVGSDAELSEAEQYWISQIRWFGHRLLNLSDGGASGSYGARWKLKPEQIRRGDAHPNFGRKHTAEANQANREKHLGKRMPETARGKAQHDRWHVNRGIVNPDCSRCSNA